MLRIILFILLSINLLAQISYIKINDSPGADGNEVDELTIPSGGGFTFYASAYDSNNSFISAISVNWSTTPTLDDTTTAGSNFVFIPTTAQTSGRIIAKYDSTRIDSTGILTVTESSIAYIMLVGLNHQIIGDTTLTVGDTLRFFAGSFDAMDNYLGDVTVDWSMLTTTGTLTGILPHGFGSSSFFIPTSIGEGRIVFESDTTNALTGFITVVERYPSLSNLVIRDAPYDLGNEVGSLNLTTDDSFTFYAAGYDSIGAYLGEVYVEWSSTGTLDIRNVIRNNYTFNPTTASSGTIIAKYNGLSDVTGTVVVTLGTLCYIKIIPKIIDSTIVYVGDPFIYYAAGYDCDWNYIGDQTSATWSTIEGLDFNTPSTGRLVADVGGITDTSGFLIVMENPLTSESLKSILPESYELKQAYPNPFNSSSIIEYSLPKPSAVLLEIFNIKGQKIATLVNQHQAAGYHKVLFDGQQLSSGIYYYRIKADEYIDTKRMVLLK